MIQLLFILIALLGVGAALGTVLARNLVHAALFLVAFFFTVACQFILLEAEFLAAIQVLIYIGAVAILILFGIMLTRNIQGDETTAGHWLGKVPAAIVATAFLVLLIGGISGQSGLGARPSWSKVAARPELAATDPRAGTLGDMAGMVGREMMTRYVVGFEVAGLLLTAALVGAIALAYEEPARDETRTSGLESRRAGAATTPEGDGQPGPVAANPVGTPR